MRNIWVLLVALGFCFFSCDEIPPEIGGTKVPPPPTEETVRKVLIEEFTGVRCVNCPAGSEAIENLLEIHGESLVAVSIHSGFFSRPYDESKYDFNTTDGDQILNFVGQPTGFPTAVVSRKEFDGETTLQIGKSKWAGTISQELEEEPVADIDISSSFDVSSRVIDLDIELQYLIDADDIDVPRLTVYIVEDKIKDYQLTPEVEDEYGVLVGGKISDYVHKHVFRDAITPFDGDNLSLGTTTGTLENKSYSYTLPEEWKEADISIIAFLHNAGSNKEIFQVEQVHL